MTRVASITLCLVACVTALCATSATSQIVHDSEYYVLEAQNGEKWAADDKLVDAKLAEFRAKNGGKPVSYTHLRAHET